MAEIITAIVSGVFTVVICIIEVRASKDRKRSDARATIRAKESRLSMEMHEANTLLGIVTAKAVTHQHTNGDVEEAIEAAEKAQKKYRSFVADIASEQVTRI